MKLTFGHGFRDIDLSSLNFLENGRLRLALGKLHEQQKVLSTRKRQHQNQIYPTAMITMREVKHYLNGIDNVRAVCPFDDQLVLRLDQCFGYLHRCTEAFGHLLHVDVSLILQQTV